MSSKILILGGSGFIGQSLCRHFAGKPGAVVFASHFKNKPIQIPNVIWQKVNLLSLNETEKIFQSHYDLVINAAAETSGSNITFLNPEIHVINNIKMNSNIFEAMSKGIHPSKYIFLSCTVMYPSSEKPHNEIELIDLNNIHTRYHGIGNTKIFLEQLCNFYSGRIDTKFISLRHSNIYGPYDKFDLYSGHVLASLVLKARSAKNSLEIWGDGSEIRDFLYISDFITAIDLINQKFSNNFGIYNLGSSQCFSVYELALKIVKLVNPSLKIIRTINNRQIKINIKIDSSKFIKEFSWLPQINIDDGLVKTYDWFCKNY